MVTQLRRLIASVLVASVTSLGLVQSVHAAMLATGTAVAAGDRERILSIVDRADVRAQLEAHGVSPVDVKARVAALTEEEAAQLAANMETLPAGGIIGAIVLVFLVLLLTDILGFTKIFPFTRSIQNR